MMSLSELWKRGNHWWNQWRGLDSDSKKQKLQHPDLERLLWCLHNGEGFNLYICQYSSIPYRIQLTTALLEQCNVVEISLLHLDAKQLIDEALHRALTRHPADLPVFIYDLERLLLTTDVEKNLRYVGQLNWRRSGFQRLQRSVVLWLPLAALELLAREAPDFYDWSSGFFHFIEPQTATRPFEPPRLDNEKTDSLSLKEKENWLAVLLEALQDDQLDTAGRAKILFDIGDLHNALGNYEAAEDSFQHALPLYQTLQDEKSIAVTMGKIADILQARGELDEALRIQREEVLPACEYLGEVRGKAVTMGKIADILEARGELDEALRIRQQEELPAYEQLGDVRSKAVTMGKIADILQARGELDEALRILQTGVLTAFDRLGDVRSKAVTMGYIADILQARGELDEALRIRQQEELPVYDRLGDVRSLLITQWQIAEQYMKMTPPRRAEANALLCQALRAAEKMRIPEAGQIERILKRFEMKC